jgi:pimeloyl-ACP methyl ester carboxylesterase
MHRGVYIVRKGVVTVLVVALLSGPGLIGGQVVSVAIADGFPTSLCPQGVGVTAITNYPTNDPTNDPEWLICLPPPLGWNGGLLLFIHGTVSPFLDGGKLEPIQGQLDFDGASIPQLATSNGFAFMVGARPKTALSVIEGVAEIEQLIDAFVDRPETPAFPVPTFLVGVSQGGLIATLVNEGAGNPVPVIGALAVCGPIGSFRGQVRYLMDFMVATDVFLRNTIAEVLKDEGLQATALLEYDAGNPHVPDEVLAHWSSVKDAILETVDSPTWQKIFDCANVPSDSVPAELIADDLLDESFRANNDAIEVLQGNPAGNRHRLYVCPSSFRNTFTLNRRAKRFATTANPEIVDLHETTGELFSPLVTLHNIADPRVPFWHEVLYLFKTLRTGSTELFTPIPVSRFGHCNVEAAEALGALQLLVSQATGMEISVPEGVLPDAESEVRFREFMEQLDTIH